MNYAFSINRSTLFLIIVNFVICCINALHVDRCCQQYRCDIDSPPDGKWTCQQQLSKWFYMCHEHHMEGYCCKTCPNSCPESKCVTPTDTDYLSIDKQTNNFIYDGVYIFLNGANQPYWDYGKDFGGHRNKDTEKHLNFGLQRIAKSGGNVVRTWIFCEGKHYPIFDTKTGNVIQSDPTDTLIDDITSYLDEAKENNIFVIFTLWNAAVDLKSYGLYQLLTDKTGTKLQSFIDIVLTPLVKATNDNPALGGWEIINEPERSLLLQETDEDCTDTAYLEGDDLLSSDTQLLVEQFQKFINIQAAAIKKIDPLALVTVGAASEKSITDEFGYSNLWKDECLIAAGGHKNGILDFYDVHTYRDEEQIYSFFSPFGDKLDNVRLYDLDKPVIVGQFGSGQEYAMMKYKLIYKKGFNGALMWAMSSKKRCKGSDGANVCMKGMKALRRMNDVDAIDMEGDPSFWGAIWKFITLVIAGLILFCKTCMVLTGCWCFKTCCKYCKKGENEEDDNNEMDGSENSNIELMVERGRWYLNDKHIKWMIVLIWSFMGFVCILGVMTGLIWIIVEVIQAEYGYQLGPTIP